jgi:hypothetical protein
VTSVPTQEAVPEVERERIDEILDLVNRVSTAYALSRRQHVWMALLRVCLYGLTTITIVSFFVAAGRIGPPDEPSGLVYWLFTAAAMGMGICWLLAPILLLLNLSALWKFYRRIRLLRETGLSKTTPVTWRLIGVRRKLLHFVSFLAVPMGLGFVFVGVMFLQSLEIKNEGWPAVVFGLGIVMTGIALMTVPVLDYLRLRFDILTDVSRLRDILSRTRESAVDRRVSLRDVSVTDLRRLAGLERTEIILERERAIELRDRSPAITRYAVEKSDEARASIRRLEPDVRWRVETYLQRLPSEMEALPAWSTRDAAEARVLVPDTALGLVLTIDEPRRRVKLLSVRSGSEPTVGTSKTHEARDV